MGQKGRTKKLRIAKGLTLPIDLVTQKVAIMGRTGSGKTYAAMKLAELLLAAGAQVVALDPVGVWYGLRLSADGKSEGFPLPVLGGPAGDIPLEPTAGALIADLVVDEGASLVVDVSFFRKNQRTQFMTDFAEQLLHRKKRSRSALHLMIEEAQTFIPQKAFKGTERLLGAMEDLVKIGRNYGIGATMVTQRPQAVNKDALNQAEALFVFQTSGPHERKAIESWIVEHGLEREEYMDSIPSLPTGECWVYSPSWLGVLERVKVLPKTTFDASATPEFGVGDEENLQTLAPVDLKALEKAMAATIEKAKAEDPKELRKRIKELERAVARAEQSAPAPEVQRVEVPILDDETKEATRLYASALSAAAETFEAGLRDLADELLPAVQEGAKIAKDLLAQLANSRQPPLATPTARKPAARAKPRPERGPDPGTADAVSNPQQRILDRLAWLETVGLAPADKTQLALFVGASPTSGGYANNLGRLRSLGMIDYPQPGTVALTPEGRSVAATPDEPATAREMQQQVQGVVSNPQWSILEQLIELYPTDIAKDELAERIGVSATSGGYANNLGRLRTYGLIDYPQPGRVVALPVLFLEVTT